MIKTKQNKHAKKSGNWYTGGENYHYRMYPMIKKPCKVVSIRNRLRKQKVSSHSIG